MSGDASRVSWMLSETVRGREWAKDRGIGVQSESFRECSFRTSPLIFPIIWTPMWVIFQLPAGSWFSLGISVNAFGPNRWNITARRGVMWLISENSWPLACQRQCLFASGRDLLLTMHSIDCSVRIIHAGGAHLLKYSKFVLRISQGKIHWNHRLIDFLDHVFYLNLTIFFGIIVFQFFHKKNYPTFEKYKYFWKSIITRT